MFDGNMDFGKIFESAKNLSERFNSQKIDEDNTLAADGYAMKDEGPETDDYEEIKTKIPEEILTYVEEEIIKRHPKMSYNDVVKTLLDNPRFTKWFKNRYEGNEFDLEQELEFLFAQPPTDDMDDSSNEAAPEDEDTYPPIVGSMRDDTEDAEEEDLGY